MNTSTGASNVLVDGFNHQLPIVFGRTASAGEQNWISLRWGGRRYKYKWGGVPESRRESVALACSAAFFVSILVSRLAAAQCFPFTFPFSSFFSSRSADLEQLQHDDKHRPAAPSSFTEGPF
jgi:hypothetical protein